MSGSEVTKNAIRHHVFALSKLFGIDPTIDECMFEFANRLETSIGLFSSAQLNFQSVLGALCEDCPNADNLVQKFNELKLRNARELSPAVYLYSSVKRDPRLKAALGHARDPRISEEELQSRVKSPNIPLARKGVDQLQQLIADSSTLTGSPLASVCSERIRTTLTSLDGPFVPSQSRLDSRMTDTLLGAAPKSNPRSHRDPLSDSQAPESQVNVIGLRSHLPSLPQWIFERSTLWNDYLPPDNNIYESSHDVPIDSLPNDMQEHAVMKDLLRLLQGNQGVYIKPVPLSSNSATRMFHVDENMTPTLLDTANKILPICSDYSIISRFIDEKSFFSEGTVNHSLASAMRRLMKDYFVLLCQLERLYRQGRLRIARLQFALQDTATLFTQLARIATDIRTGNCTGGAVLSLLHDSARKVLAVPQLHDLMLYLLRSASVPFFAILQKWIYRGVISDPYREFFITAGPTPKCLQACLVGGLSESERAMQENVDWAYFWDQHYSVVPHNLPTFLDTHVSKCLNSGKYLNVVQQCADNYELPPQETIEFNENEFRYLDQIDRAHSYASGLLLKLMIKDKELKQHLSSVKRYFLLDQADFIVHFMDAAASELCKPSTEVSLLRLSSLLELAIRTSTATTDPFKDNLKVVIYSYDLITQILMVLQAGSGVEQANTPVEDSNLTGLEAFSVDYSVNWPISLVLNRQVMDRYQMLFRHMFYCKHVERRLCSAWVLGKMARKADCLTSTWFTTAFLLGQRMLTFVQHIQYYMAVEVIEPTWHLFFTQLDKVSNLDALLEAHLYCLEVCMDDCLLASPDLLSLFGKLAVICVLFANFVQHVLSCSFGGLSDGDLVRELELQDRRNPHPSVHHETYDRRSTPRSSYAGSIVSVDTVLTKVTRDDFNQIGTSAAFAHSVIDFDRKFNSLLVEFVQKLKHYAKQRTKLSSLVSRLDFNDFYSTATSPSLVDNPDEFGDAHGGSCAESCNLGRFESATKLVFPSESHDNDGDYI